MKDLSRKLNIALIVITHNLGVVARYADRVIVMYASRLVEEGDADDVFHRPRHPYSMGLLRSVPRLDRPRGAKLETIEGLPPNAALTAARLPLCAALPLQDRDLRDRARACCAPIPAGCRAAIATRRSPRARSCGPRPAPTPSISAHKTGEPLLSVRNLTKHFEVRGGLRGAGGTVRAVRGCVLRHHAGRDARTGRRIRLRQDHGRPADPASRGADRRRNCASRAATCRRPAPPR